MNEPYDFLVIGGGSAGYAAARSAVDHGLRVAVVDGARELGGLCILRGCMPSKTLIESANRLRAIRRAGEFGLKVGAASAETGAIIARKRRLIAEFADYRRGQLESGRFELIRGTARFLDAHRVAVSPLEGGPEREVAFHTAVVASGSEVSRIPVAGLETCGYWTSDDLLEADSLPGRIIVLGGGAIALEMACYLEGLGREVVVIQRSNHILSGADTDVALALEQALRTRSEFELYTGTHLLEVARDARGGKIVRFEHQGATREVHGDEILLATGRVPRTAGLDCEAAGIELARGGIVADAEQRTRVPHLFAAGDVCGPHEIVHIAIEQGEIAAHNAALLRGTRTGSPRRIDYRLKLLGIFTEPEVAMVGLTEAESKEAGMEIEVATYPFDDHGKSMVRGQTEGFVKMIAHAKTGEIIGAAVVGPEAVELIHEVTVAMHFRCTAEQFLRIPHYHPTLSEIWTYPAEDLSTAIGMR